MNDLIARLGSVSEGSRELDARITVTLQLKPEWLRGCDRDLVLVPPDPRFAPFSTYTVAAGRYGPSVEIAHYTTSLDAALTLVPEGMEWHVSNRGQIGAHRLCFASIYGPPMVGSECDANAATPALALCVASLKARQHKSEAA